jgi:hypothetical protein
MCRKYIHGTWTCGFGFAHGNSKSDTDRGSWAQTLTWKIGHKLGKWKPPVLIFSEKREKNYSGHENCAKKLIQSYGSGSDYSLL